MKTLENIEMNSRVFTAHEFEEAEYYNCRFLSCNFRQANIGKTVFEKCCFERSELLQVGLSRTGFHGVEFKDYKLIGVNFNDANEFGFDVGFENSIVDACSFDGLSFEGKTFNHVRFLNNDFVCVNFAHSLFLDCDFKNSTFERSNLGKCDFRTSVNFSIDLEHNKIKGAKFDLHSVIGLLGKYGIEIE